MTYTDGVIIFLVLSILFYLILGGADFGAGILELIIGDRGVSTVYRAIAPVWEANHMWLIIAVVILFNAFPGVYALVSTALHIPIMLLLIGLILRGTAFTFRHYDAKVDGTRKVYSRVFRWSSALTVFSIGLVVAPLIGGTIPATMGGSFHDYYIAPWLNGFSIFTGLFIMTLSAYIAAIFLLGEVKTHSGYELIKNAIKWLLVASMISGIGLFLFSFFENRHFHQRFLEEVTSICALGLATLAIPYIRKLIQQKKIWSMRIVVGLQILFILAGMLLIQYPALLVHSDGSTLNAYALAAPEATMKVLFWALMIGVLIIFPALYYLFKVFKTDIKS